MSWLMSASSSNSATFCQTNQHSVGPGSRVSCGRDLPGVPESPDPVKPGLGLGAQHPGRQLPSGPCRDSARVLLATRGSPASAEPLTASGLLATATCAPHPSEDDTLLPGAERSLVLHHGGRSRGRDGARRMPAGTRTGTAGGRMDGWTGARRKDGDRDEQDRGQQDRRRRGRWREGTGTHKWKRKQGEGTEDRRRRTNGKERKTGRRTDGWMGRGWADGPRWRVAEGPVDRRWTDGDGDGDGQRPTSPPGDRPPAGRCSCGARRT